jgi:beta-galactosidase
MLLYGGDYNPEQWPEATWPEDVRLMREAGVNVVTVGVFSWARIEPRPGERDLGWLDRALDLLHAGGIRVFLATPTASPPPWMGHRWPETLPVDDGGHRLHYGSRNQFCPSSPVYREQALALVRDLAARYAGHRALAAWHVGNESGPSCWCDRTAEHFRRWLLARYGDLDGLNDAWGTTVWSQRYDDLIEVLPPRRAPWLRNPTQELDFRRFTSDALLELFLAERETLRRAAPEVPVTTNFIHLSGQVDQWAWAAQEDLVSVDLYPDPEDPNSHLEGAFGCDVARSLGGGRPWALMEQAPSAVNWRPRNLAKRPGQLRLWSLQAVARGADAVCSFQWRASRVGAERHHSGMVPHAGEDSRVFREVRALGADLRRLGEVAGQRVRAPVALLLDWEDRWALELGGHPRQDLSLADLVADWFRPLWRMGVVADVARPGSDLSAYAVVVAPNLYLVTDAAAARLAAYVAAGGCLVVGFFSGVVDERLHVRLGGWPAPAALRDAVGVRVEEHRPLGAAERLDCASEALGRFGATYWMDDLRAEGASAVASVEDGDFAGMPVVLRNAHGRGAAWYVGTRPDEAGRAAIVRRVCADAGVRSAVTDPPAGVECVLRGDVLFLLNHGDRAARVEVAGAHEDLLTGARSDGSVTLDRFGVAALRGLRPGGPASG